VAPDPDVKGGFSSQNRLKTVVGYSVIITPDCPETPSDQHGSKSENVTSFGPAALQYEASILGLHAAQKTVRLSPAPVVGLEGALHHPPHRPFPAGWANL
jgi:hypothetical protein